MTMAAIGHLTPPKMTSKSFSIWGGHITVNTEPPLQEHSGCEIILVDDHEEGCT